MAQEQRELSAAVLSLNTPHISLKARITAAEWQRPLRLCVCPQVGHNLLTLKSKTIITSMIFNEKVSELKQT